MHEESSRFELERDASVPRRLIVFVPGIMGSALRYTGPGPLGNLVRDFVWSEDVGGILFGRGLDLLSYPTPSGAKISAEYIIEGATLLGLGVPGYETYATLLRRWRELAHSKRQDLMEFPYDWRQSTSVSATQLNRKIIERVSNKRIHSVALVGHSLGGLVCRLAAGTSEELRRYVRLLVCIATPLQGALKAFYTLKREPSLNSAFDWSLYLVRVKEAVTGGSRFNALMDTIRTFPSVYELLPPKELTYLITETGRTKSCMDEDLWPDYFRSRLDDAKRVQDRLAQVRLNRPVLVIYSAGYPTPQAYLIRGTPPYILDKLANQMVHGDGTVTVQSATYDCPVEMRYLVKNKPYGHNNLCRNEEALAMLEGLLFDV